MIRYAVLMIAIALVGCAAPKRDFSKKPMLDYWTSAPEEWKQ